MLKRSLSLLLFSLFAYAETGVVDRIIDGDTIKFTDGVTCRFAYIDTPESSFNSRAIDKIKLCNKYLYVDKYDMLKSGNLSKNFLKEKIKKDDILTYDVISLDKYSRKVCSIFNNKSENINLLLVKEGFAVPYNKYIKDINLRQTFNNSYYVAKDEKKGIHKTNEEVMECLKISN